MKTLILSLTILFISFSCTDKTIKEKKSEVENIEQKTVPNKQGLTIYKDLASLNLKGENNTEALKNILANNFDANSEVVRSASKSENLKLHAVNLANGLKDFVILNENEDIIFAFKNEK